jgi:hypothetical protein
LQAISEHVSTNHTVRVLPPQVAERLPHHMPRRQQHMPHTATALHR